MTSEDMRTHLMALDWVHDGRKDLDNRMEYWRPRNWSGIPFPLNQAYELMKGHSRHGMENRTPQAAKETEAQALS